MRVPKYQAWDKDKKQMIAVPHLSFGDDGSARTVTITLRTPEGYARMLVIGENAELRAFTGLTDKHGNEIYEGDIVQWSEYGSGLWEVKWCDGKRENLGNQLGWILEDERFCSTGHTMALEAYLHWSESDREEYANMEVIGNIYENSDVLTS